MAASQDECIVQFPRSQVCLDRNAARIIAWSAYITALPLPDAGTTPEKPWVQQRVLAERVPLNGSSYVPQISTYLTQIPNITQKIRDHLNAYNDDGTEQVLGTDIDQSLATVMPEFADAVIWDQDVANWCDKNGYPRPPGLINVTPPPGSLNR